MRSNEFWIVFIRAKICIDFSKERWNKPLVYSAWWGFNFKLQQLSIWFGIVDCLNLFRHLPLCKDLSKSNTKTSYNRFVKNSHCQMGHELCSYIMFWSHMNMLVCCLIMGALKLHHSFKTSVFESKNGETGHV